MTVEEAIKYLDLGVMESIHAARSGLGIYAAASTLAAEVERLRGELGNALDRAEAAEQAATNLRHAVDTMDEAKAIRDKILARVISERDELSRDAERLNTLLDISNAHNKESDSKISNMVVAVGRMRKALARLACLGNGDQPGNSIGNTIAREALLKDTGEL